jgi:hypothetical protein
LVVLACALSWASIQACGGVSFDDARDRREATGGTAGHDGDSVGGDGGFAGSGTGASGGMPGAGMSGAAGTGGVGMSGAAGTGGVGTSGAAGTAGAGAAGGVCEEVRTAINEEVAALRSCSLDSECGQILSGTGCGCSRELVGRLNVDTTRLDELLATEVDGEPCYDPGGGSCDCPFVAGYECKDNQCSWRYDTMFCQNEPIASLCVVRPDDGVLEVGDTLTISAGVQSCFSSSCTQMEIGECSVGGGNGSYSATARFCLRVDPYTECGDDCDGVRSVTCQAATPLSAGTNRVSLGNFSVEFEVPSAFSGSRCNSFAASGPEGRP